MSDRSHDRRRGLPGGLNTGSASVDPLGSVQQESRRTKKSRGFAEKQRIRARMTRMLPVAVRWTAVKE